MSLKINMLQITFKKPSEILVASMASFHVDWEIKKSLLNAMHSPVTSQFWIEFPQIRTVGCNHVKHVFGA